MKDLIQRYIIRQRGEQFLKEQVESMGSYDIPLEQVNCGFSHENRRTELSDEEVADNVRKVNKVRFTQGFIETLRYKLLLSYEETRRYIMEYKRFLIMITCSREISTPSE